MARENKLGTSFCGLDLEVDEEQKVKELLAEKIISAKQYLRYLVRKDLKKREVINQIKQDGKRNHHTT